MKPRSKPKPTRYVIRKMKKGFYRLTVNGKKWGTYGSLRRAQDERDLLRFYER